MMDWNTELDQVEMKQNHHTDEGKMETNSERLNGKAEQDKMYQKYKTKYRLVAKAEA